MAVGVEWPIRHVVDQLTLASRRHTSADQLVLEMFDERAWTPVRSGLTVAARDRTGQVVVVLCTRGDAQPARATLAGADWRPTELEVQRYWPADKTTWPARLVQTGACSQRELLAGEADPTFEPVAAAALSMTPARAFVGTPDGQREIGVAWDGTVIGRDVVSFVIGPSPTGWPTHAKPCSGDCSTAGFRPWSRRRNWANPCRCATDRVLTGGRSRILTVRRPMFVCS